MAETLDLLKSKRDELAGKLELEAVQCEIESLEQLTRWLGPNPGPYSEEFGQPIPRDEMLRDIGWGSAYYLWDDWNSRANGDDRPILETEQQLAGHRARSRLICHEVPPAIGALRNLQNYIIGTKWAFPVVPREKDSEDAKAVATALGIVVDLILESNQWIGLRDKETYKRTVRDGDGFIRIKAGPDGIPRFQFAEPCWVTQPRDPRELNHWLRVSDKYAPNWKWGVLTADKDHATPLGYHVVYDGKGDCWDFLTPDEFHHIKVGTDEGVKRGISEFYCVRNHFPRGDQVFQMVADGAKVQAAIAGVREFAKEAKNEDIERVAGAGRTHTRTQSTQFGPREVDVTNFDRPKVLSVKGYTWKEGPMGASRNPNLILAGQAILRLTGARWNMPEWMTTGDASNNNLASSLVAESPFVKACEADQTFYGHHFVELIWKAIRVYLRTKGAIAGFRSVQELRAVCKITSAPPGVASRDSLKEVQTAKEKQAMGIASRKTLATELGLDYETERPQIEDEPPLPGTAQAPTSMGVAESLHHFFYENCGTGAGGFKSGNSCGDEGGGGSSGGGSKVPKLNTTETNAIKDYSGDAFVKINGELRGGKMGPDTAKTVKAIDSALAKAPKHTGVVFRQIKSTPQIEKMLASGVISDSAYTSTRKNAPKFVPKGDIALQIVGKNGVDISKISNNPGEGEVLFPRNSKFKVVKSKEMPTGGRAYIVQQIESIEVSPAFRGAVQGALESSETAEDVKQILREIREELVANG